MSEQRLQKILAEAGLASRRKAEAMIRAGRVQVNGAPATLGAKADPESDEILLDGAPVLREAQIYYLLNKPRGVLTTTVDTRGRKTVVDLLPEGLARVFPVGRLDLDTEGLLLLTNDGEMAHALLHPSLGNEREYRVTVRGAMGKVALAKLAEGIELEDGPTAPARVEKVRIDRTAQTTRLNMTLVEGRKRQIRRTLDALGHPVLELLRVRMGPLELGRLAPGGVRRLRLPEVEVLREHVARLQERGSKTAVDDKPIQGKADS